MFAAELEMEGEPTMSESDSASQHSDDPSFVPTPHKKKKGRKSLSKREMNPMRTAVSHSKVVRCGTATNIPESLLFLNILNRFF